MPDSQALARMGRDVLLDVFLFPVWWYSTGLLKIVQYVGDGVAGYARSLGLKVWLKNLFVPMFGQRDWQSRIISVFMRLAQIIFRTLALFVWMILGAAMIMLYIAAPAVALGFIFFHSIGSLTSSL